MGQRTLASGNQDRNNLYSSTESNKLARAIYPDTGELLFALSCSRSIEWEKTIASMEDMNPGVAKMWNVNMNISKKWYEIMGFDYDDMVQEALHRDGRNAIVVIEFGVQHAALCGCEDKLLSHWTKNCKISMSNGSYVIFNDGQSVQGRTRVGGASRLVSHPDFIGPAFVASLTDLQREWMEPIMFLGVLYRISHCPLKSRDVNVELKYAKEVYILQRQFARAIVALGGGGRLKIL